MSIEDGDKRNDTTLFELPAGIAIVAEERHLIRDSQAGGNRKLRGFDAAGFCADLGAMDIAQGERLLSGFDPEAGICRVGTQADGPANAPRLRGTYPSKTWLVTRSKGAHFVYALLLLTLTLGIVGLAFTSRDSRVLIACSVVAPVSLIWFLVRFHWWLNRSPYWYRLMTSLGENSENISQFTVRQMCRRAIRTLYS